MLPTSAASLRRGFPILRIGIAAALVGVTALIFSGSAAGHALDDPDARMRSVQGDLDATTDKIEDLRDDADRLASEIDDIEARTEQLLRERERLVDDAVARPNQLYGTGSVGAVEAPLPFDVSLQLSRTEAELQVLEGDLRDRREELDRNRKLLARETERLQVQFQKGASEYQMLRRKLPQAQARPAAAAAGGGSPSLQVKVTGGMTCPVVGSVSFTDSWGDPRSNHAHQGVDMMADYGTPLVAITSGTPSYVAYDGAGGNMIFLEGDDGNSYWYVHNQENLVSVGQRVEAGEQIATVGDTGNAAGTPHVHFEFHPGGGEAVNPYPLVASLC